MPTKKKPKPSKGAKKPPMKVQNVRLEADTFAAMNDLIETLGGEPYKKSYVARAAFKRGLQGLIKDPSPQKVRRAHDIKFGG